MSGRLSTSSTGFSAVVFLASNRPTYVLRPARADLN